MPGGKEKGAGGKGGPKEGRAERLWTDKPFVSDDHFKCLRTKFLEKFPGSCWYAVVQGCNKADCTLTHKVPAGFNAVVKECGIGK